MSHRDDSVNNSREEQAGDFPMIDSNMHFKVEWDAEGHATEDSVYAWLDGALAPSDSGLVEAHVSGCDSCAAAVAEARGFIAASVRILSVADYVPQRVIPGADVARSAARIVALASARVEKSGTNPARLQADSSKRSSKGGFRFPIAVGIAAAVVVMVGGSLLVLREHSSSPAGTPASTSTIAASAPRKDSITKVIESPSKEARTGPIAATTKSNQPSRENQNAKTVAQLAEQKLRERERSVAVGESLSLIRRSAPQAMPAVAIQATPEPREQRTLSFSVATIATVAAVDSVRELTGRVVESASSKPIESVQVRVPGSTQSAVTDSDGRFVLRNVPASAQKLQFRRIGYEGREIDIVSSLNSPVRDVQLSPSTLQLSEMVVTSVGAGASSRNRPEEIPGPRCTLADAELARTDLPIVRRISVQSASGGFAQGSLFDWPKSGDITSIRFNASESRILRGTGTVGDARVEISIEMQTATWLVDIREYRGNNVRAANEKFLVNAGASGCE